MIGERDEAQECVQEAFVRAWSHEALRALPEEQRRALVLHYLCDLSVAEVAAEVGAPVDTLAVRHTAPEWFDGRVLHVYADQAAARQVLFELVRLYEFCEEDVFPGPPRKRSPPRQSARSPTGRRATW